MLDIEVSKRHKTLSSLSVDSSEGDHQKYKLQIVVSAMMEKNKLPESIREGA